MKLKINFELPISPQHEEYISFIAKIHGWSEVSDISSSEYVCKRICEPQISDLIKNIIQNAMNSCFGFSKIKETSELIDSYTSAKTIEAKIVSE